MHVKTVIYNKVFSLGNYENEKIGIEIELKEGEDPQKAIQDARQYVEYNHKVNGMVNEMNECEHVVAHPDDFTGTQVKRAQERIEFIKSFINEGKKLLS